MSFKRTVLVTAVIAALTACAGTGEKKPDAPAADRQSQQAQEPVPVSPPPAPALVADNSVPSSDAAMSSVSSSPPKDPAPASAADPVESAPPAAPPPSEPIQEPVPLTPPKSVPPAAAVKPMPARGPSSVTLDKAPRTFSVTVDTKDANHPNFGRGSNFGFVVDGMPGKELALTRGVTYTFAVRTGIQHDFYFTTSPVGHGAGAVTDGVVGQFIYNGDAQFTPTATTPSVVYYECRNHKYMGGKIHVGNAGEKVVLGAPDASKQEKTEEVKRTVTPEQVKQKLGFADMMIGSSAAAKRVAASNNAEAKKFAAEAKQQLATARSALDAGKNNDAMASVDEALRLMNSATALVPDESAASEEKANYTTLLEQIRGFEGSYQRNVARGMKLKSGAELDKNKFSRMMSEADALAGKGQYGEAVKRLEAANELLTTALTAMLDSQTVVYEKNFSTPKEEYEYELARYGSYAELVPVAIEQRHPSPQTITMMDELTKRAQEIRGEALALAQKSDYKMAIMALQAATERVQKALRLAGVQ